jgi:hypothetical protein
MNALTNPKTLRVVNIVALVLTLIVNGLSNSSLFPRTMAEIGNARPLFFLPAAYVFAVWGVIYTLLIGFLIYSFRPIAQEKRSVEKVGVWFLVSCIANSIWLIFFLYDQLWLSTVAMLVLLTSLISIYLRLEIGKRAVDWQEDWAVLMPFRVYLGWISVATVANFTAALYDSGAITAWLGIGSDVWAVLMMAVAGVLAFLMLARRKDIAFALVVIWALVGINLRPFDTEMYQVLSALNAGLVDTSALVVAGAVAIGIAWQAFTSRRMA